LAAPHVSALVLSCCVAAVVVGVGVADYRQFAADGGGPDAAGGPSRPA
jgi:hypothetical protein